MYYNSITRKLRIFEKNILASLFCELFTFSFKNCLKEKQKQLFKIINCTFQKLLQFIFYSSETTFVHHIVD